MTILGLSFGGYLMTCIWLSIVVGMAILYPLERLVGTRVYRALHDFFHPNEEAMAGHVDRGLLYGQSTYHQLTVLTVLSVVQSIYMVWSHHVNPAAEIVAAFIEVPFTLVGFWIGGWAHPYVHQRKKYLDKLDKMRSGDIAAGARKVAGSILGSFLSLYTRTKEVVFPSVKQVTKPHPPQEELQKEATPDVPHEDPRDVIDRYTGRRR